MYSIILFAPLLGAIIAGLFGRAIGDRPAMFITTGLLFLSALLSWIVFFGHHGETEIVSLARWMGSSGDGGYAKLLDAAKASDQPNVNGIGAQVAASLERLGAASFDLAGLDEHLKQDLASLPFAYQKHLAFVMDGYNWIS